MRSTHTLALLDLPKAMYEFVRDKMKAAGYEHAFLEDGIIDMHGIGLSVDEDSAFLQSISNPPVAFSENGALFWYGDPAERRDFTGDLYAAPQASAPVADESPMAKMAEALREKARQEQRAYQDRRDQATEWGPMPVGTEADDPNALAALADGLESIVGNENAKLAAVIIRRMASAPEVGEAQPVAYRAWFDQDNGARWLFTLWPEEERLDVQWEPLYAAPQASTPTVIDLGETGSIYGATIRGSARMMAKSIEQLSQVTIISDDFSGIDTAVVDGRDGGKAPPIGEGCTYQNSPDAYGLKSAPAAEDSAKDAGDAALLDALRQIAAWPDGGERYGQEKIKRFAQDAIDAAKAFADRQQRGGDVGRAALEWYAEQAAGCRKLGAAGDRAREALDKDGGQRARAALAATKGESNE